MMKSVLAIALICAVPAIKADANCEDCLTFGIALAMYPVFLEPNSVCGQIGLCKKNSYKKTMVPTCEDCPMGVGAISNIIGQEATIMEIMDFLKGDGYCGGLGDENCEMVVDALMPYAMPALAGVLVERAETLCCELSTDAVCC